MQGAYMTGGSALNYQALNQPVGWGILGTGYIAGMFAADLACVAGARLVAVGSRSKEKADAFGERFGIPHRHGSYAELVQDSQVQAVYIATPPSAHKENMLLCLNAAKAVLCEKPFTVNAREAEEVIDLARRKKVFLMEAMWTRFLPAMGKVRELLAEGTIGEAKSLSADLGSPVSEEQRGRMYDPGLGGGVVLHKGVYLLSLSSMILGTPTEIKSLGYVGETGVDEEVGIVLSCPAQRMAVLHCSMRVHTAREAVIIGTKGTMRIHAPVNCPSRLSLTQHQGRDRHGGDGNSPLRSRAKDLFISYGKRSRMVRWARERCWALGEFLLHGTRTQELFFPPIGHGLHYQVAEVTKCLRLRQLESDIMPLDETLSIMRTMDQIRGQKD